MFSPRPLMAMNNGSATGNESLAPFWLPKLKYLFLLLPLIIALASFAGYLAGGDMSGDVDTGLAMMNPLTALGLILLGVPLLLADIYRIRLFVRYGGYVVCALVALAAGAQLISWFVDVPAIDGSFLSKLVATSADAARHVLSPNITLSLLALAGASFLIHQKDRPHVMLSQTLSLAAMAGALLVLIGTLYHAHWSAGPAFFMPVSTAFAFFLFALAQWFTAADGGVMRLLTETGPGGKTARALLPVAIVLPVFIGWLRLQSEGAGAVDSDAEIRLALTTLVYVLLLMGMVFWNAYRMVQLESERRRIEAELAYHTTHDRLTGLVNRSMLLDFMVRRLALAKRRPSPRFIIMLVDLIDFKSVNERFGHGAGDSLLKQAAETLMQCVRSYDVVARLEADSFIVILDDTDEMSHARIVADRVLSQMPINFTRGKNTAQVHVSIGLLMAMPQHNSPEDLLVDVEAACLRAREMGPDHYSFYNPIAPEKA